MRHGLILRSKTSGNGEISSYFTSVGRPVSFCQFMARCAGGLGRTWPAPTEATSLPSDSMSRVWLPMAGFQVIMLGRF
jgi:hypothetical protein